MGSYFHLMLDFPSHLASTASAWPREGMGAERADHLCPALGWHLWPLLGSSLPGSSLCLVGNRKPSSLLSSFQSLTLLIYPPHIAFLRLVLFLISPRSSVPSQPFITHISYSVASTSLLICPRLPFHRWSFPLSLPDNLLAHPSLSPGPISVADFPQFLLRSYFPHFPFLSFCYRLPQPFRIMFASFARGPSMKFHLCLTPDILSSWSSASVSLGRFEKFGISGDRNWSVC